MRGVDHQQSQMFSYMSPETRVGKLTPSFREPAETSADLRGPATPRFAEFGRTSLLVVPLGNSDYLSACWRQKQLSLQVL